AALSLARVIVVFVTEGTTRSAMRIALRTGVRPGTAAPTASQINSVITTTLALAIIVGIFSIGVWIFIARASLRGLRWARIAGTVLFVLDTVVVLIGPPGLGAGATGAAAARVASSIVWLAALGATAFLWRKGSSAFFRAEPAPPRKTGPAPPRKAAPARPGRGQLSVVQPGRANKSPDGRRARGQGPARRPRASK
ncbi:MAG TPA: hypothetical protein VGH88_13835, partial [Streptosporangiaceae bacterium]